MKMTGSEEILLPVSSDLDIIKARQKGRDLAAWADFAVVDQTLIATAISEIARNIVTYARRGTIVLRIEEESDRLGLVVIACDQGPGIRDVTQALRDHYTTSHGFGMGLPGARRVMDDFAIESKLGEGTRITMKKWRTKQSAP
jgi:serine/threonine-protein kinase RsbT